MKKLIVLALLATLACGAYASSVAVPWFSDFAAAGTSVFPSNNPGLFGVQMSTYITLKNNTTDELLCAITYSDAKGNDQTPAANTFVIGANSVVGFRPVADDISEAPNAGSTPGPQYLVPNATSNTDGTDPLPAGSAKVEWVGGVKDVQGIVTLSNMSAAVLSQSSYLLPEGE